MNFFTYLRSRAVFIGAFCVFCAVFSASFLLYHLPFGAVGYPAAVCAVLGLLLLLFDFLRCKKRCEAVRELARLTSEQIAALPRPADDTEAAYCDLVRALLDEIEEVRTADSAKYNDMIDYYSVWAHQIKTPIAAMRLALRDEDSALSRRLSSDLFRIEQYVGMVLTFLRLDADSTDYVFRSVALDDVIRASVRKFAPEFISRRIRLEFEPCGAELVTDEKWLSFVIGQLLSNALKYTKEGGCVQIRVDEPLTLRIRDTGIGIAPADLPRIFEKGYTGFNGRSGDAADRPSSGIGLYLCRRVCRNLGAVISAESEVGVGTTVSVALENRRERVE